jgi:non-specific protein-tyrosine kinase
MELNDYARSLRKGRYLIVVCVMLTLAVAALITMRSPKIYSASITMFVSFDVVSGPGANANAVYDGNLAAKERVKSYADLVGGERVAAGVIQKLSLDETPEKLAARIDGSAVTDTVLLKVSVTDRSPRRAQQIADAVGDVFSRQVTQVETPAAGQDAPVRVIVWEQAKTPSAPISPRPTINLVLGLIVGLAVGIGLAVLRFRLDTTVRLPEDVAEVVELPVLGAVVVDPEAARTPLALQARPMAPRSESFRQLRTNLQFVDVDGRPRVVAVTSALPAEGKTSTACNLAVALAQTGAGVVLVEADLRRPAFDRYLGVEGAAGLTSVLIGRASLEDVLQPFGDQRLMALPSGPLPPNPSELLGSKAMTTVIDELRAVFDYVIVDVPPLLPVTDGAVVSALADGTLLVVRAGKTRREQLGQAAALLHNVGARTLGVVLNMIPVKGSDSYSYAGSHDPAAQRDRLGNAPRPTPALSRHRQGRTPVSQHRDRSARHSFDDAKTDARDGRRVAEEEPDGPRLGAQNQPRVDYPVGTAASAVRGPDSYQYRRNNDHPDPPFTHGPSRHGEDSK